MGSLGVLIIVLIGLAALGFLGAAAVLAIAAMVYIPPTRHRFAMVERRYGSLRAPGSYAAAIRRHTELLAPGQVRFRPRWKYKVTFADLIYVPVDSVGIVHAERGAP